MLAQRAAGVPEDTECGRRGWRDRHMPRGARGMGRERKSEGSAVLGQATSNRECSEGCSGKVVQEEGRTSAEESPRGVEKAAERAPR